MEVPKSFQPRKKLNKDLERLIKNPKIFDYEVYEKKIDVLSKLNLDKGILYAGLRPIEFKQSDLPYENIVYASLACANLEERFYRYRFNYKSKGEGLCWLDIVDKKYRTIPREDKFNQLVNHVKNYYNMPQGCRTRENTYELRLDKPQSKNDLIEVIDKFYTLKFPYLGAKYNMFFTKILYKGLTDEEFLNSNLPLKRIEVNFKNHFKLIKDFV